MASNPENNFLFGLNASERYEQLYAVVKAAVSSKIANNLPVVYRNVLCVKSNQFIHEYPNGQIFLISQNQKTSEEKVIRQLR
jgi:hypothetical protein